LGIGTQVALTLSGATLVVSLVAYFVRLALRLVS
jgi:hypothetical protein